MIKIVIGDDEAELREGLTCLIESYQLNVQVVALCKDGIETLEAIKRYRPHLLFIDINMPSMNGLEAIAQINKLQTNCKICILSGYDSFAYAQKAIDLKVCRYLLKPIDHRTFKEDFMEILNEIELDDLSEADYQTLEGQIMNKLEKDFREETLSLKSLALEFHASQSYLSNVIKNKKGLSFTEYITNLRMNEAIQLLSNSPALSIHDIALACGFTSQHYFSRLFKKEMNMTPLEYRKERQN